MTFKQKLNLSYTLIIVILIVIVSYCHYLIHLSNTKQNMEVTMDEISNQIALNLDVYVSELVSSTIQPLYDRTQIERLITGKSIDSLKLNETTQLENYIRNTYLYPNSQDIMAVHVFDRAGGSLNLYQKDQQYVYAPQSTSAFVEAVKKHGKSAVSNTTLVRPSNSQTETPMFSIFRQLNIFELNQPYGMLVLDINFSKIDRLLRNVELEQGSSLTLVNEQNQIIYSMDRNLITSPAPALDAHQWLQAEANLETIPWTIRLDVPLNSVLNRKEMLLTSLLIMVAAILAAVLFSGWFSRKVTLPLEQLRRLMRRAEYGEFNLKFRAKSQDEIAHLGNSFNQMTTRIKELIDRSYVAEIRQRDAQFSALQSQINPHFLFNTLETIRMTAETEGNPETVKMIASLGKLLKVNFQQQSWVTIRQELDYIEHYLLLQSARLSYPPTIEIECGESAKNIPILAFLIQPLVENSILHGLRPISRPGLIRIHIAENQADAKIEIAITDDGAGMTPERLEAVRSRIRLSSDEPSPEASIGLLNIQRRIKLSYGNKYGLEIDSREDRGTSVVCRIPCNQIPKRHGKGDDLDHEYISYGDRG
ncbi:sensor histidine kinase [Saccharibacillus sacchari]|uniref:Sensor histidine kinase n=1 Tax=Saccharibacillus sacchari TaxID=456493 RepID=A0ACC6PEG9_9BACL